MKKQLFATAMLATLVTGGRGTLRAQEPPVPDVMPQQDIMTQNNTPERNQSFGLNNIWTSIGAPEFAPLSRTLPPIWAGYGYVSPAPANDRGYYWAQLNLPNGAEVKYIEMAVYDNDPDGWVAFTVNGVQAYTPHFDPSPELEHFGSASTSSISTTPRYATISMIPSQPLVIHDSADFDGDGNGTTYYYIYVQTQRGASANDNDLRFFGAAVRWTRTLSLPPTTASFDDVPVDYWAFQHIEALAKSGITSGCDASNFCPEDPLTRAQMAVFLAKALGLHWPW